MRKIASGRFRKLWPLDNDSFPVYLIGVGFFAFLTVYDIGLVETGFDTIGESQAWRAVFLASILVLATIAAAITMRLTQDKAPRGVIRLYAIVVVLWTGAIFVSIAFTHRIPGLRHIFDPGVIDTPLEMALLTYDTVVFAAASLGIVIAPWWWRRRRIAISKPTKNQKRHLG